MKHFGRYPSLRSTRAALLRCQHSTPKKKMKKIKIKQTHVENIGTKKRYEDFGLYGDNKQQEYTERLRSMIMTPVPDFIRREIGGLKLFILDKTPKGYMALYRSALSEEKYRFRVWVIQNMILRYRISG